MSNLLKNETSPYLIQHADNPVNWYPWCEEAFERARAENKPIFLSIGYSTCHWCHVMAHESFENKKTAEILNECFISIQVGREERPDIDSICMTVCQSFTGHGGWPMSIFMTWDKKPFFAGTYFPPNSKYGMPGFPELLQTIAKQWNLNRREILNSAEKAVDILKSTQNVQRESGKGNPAEEAVRIFKKSFDAANGGFGTAPKFPTPHNLLFLMLYAKQNSQSDVFKMAEKTLIQMRKGGIFDHIGYGFSRYSTDQYYLAPHFQKVLYDNSLLIIAYAAAYSTSHNDIFLDTAEKTAQYVLNEMTSCDGGFFSAQDADSEGVEGKYYTFSSEEISDVLGEKRGKRFAEIFDITEKGNFEGKNIPNLLKSNALGAEFADELKLLYEYRQKRFKLHVDDKILLSWNCMMTAALAVLFRVTQKEKYISAAKKSLNFIEKNLSSGTQLYTSCRSGKHSEHAFLDDYAFLSAALIEMYNSTLDSNLLLKAENICNEAVKRFSDHENGGFFLCETNKNELFMNPKEIYDNAVPSGNSVMAYNFVRLYQLTQKEDYLNLAQKQIDFMSASALEYPSGCCMFLIAALLLDNPPEHITIAVKDGTNSADYLKKLPFLANISVVAQCKEYPLLNGRTTYYICKNHSCLPPTNDPGDLTT